MRKAALCLLTLALAVSTLAPAALAQPAGPPRVSPMATTSQVVGISEVSVTYSRPSVRDRSVWGELVPYGEVWRTGANEASTLTLSHEATVGGKKVPAGTYALFTIPGKGEWTVILNKEAEQWGAFSYKEDQDQVRFSAKAESAAFREAFEVTFPEVTGDTATVCIHWKETAIHFPVHFDTTALTVEKARKEVAAATPDNAGGRTIWGWANYCYQNDVNLAEALTWADQLSTNAQVYWVHALKARLLAKNGKHQEAVTAAEQAVKLTEGDAGQQPGVQNDLANLKKQVSAWKDGASAG